MNCKYSFIGLLLLLAASPALAITKDLGVVGKTYPVVEPDILAEIQEQTVEKSQLTIEQMFDRMKNYQPASLHALPHAIADKSFQVDMTYTLNRDLTDTDGRAIYPKGYTFNPLEYVTMHGGLMVIDGDDPRHVEWLKKTPYADNHRVRLLLSSGHAFGLVEKLQRPVFYLTDDIARRLSLTAVPSLVIQQGDKMQIHEFYVPNEMQVTSDENN